MSKPMVEAYGLRKAFGKVQALDGLSLAVPAGSVLGLLGPNGSGKTTTVSILTTSLRPDAGRATVGGHYALRRPRLPPARPGLCQQERPPRHLFPGPERPPHGNPHPR
jgi:ABC-type multidrug transport system ATPase subunit